MNPALFRRGSSDANIWSSVVDGNEYRLPDRFESDSLILDIGLNTGAFAYACLQRGAGKVIGFEPDPDNYTIARKQLRQEIKDGRCEVYPLAVIGGSGFEWRTFSGTVQKNGEINHGGAFLFGRDGSNYGLGEYIVNDPFRVPCVGIQHVYDLLPPDSAKMNKRLCKIDAEGSEWEILSDGCLSEFQEVSGEYHPHSGFTKEHLSVFLYEIGLKAEILPHQGSELGLFFGTRK